MTDFKIGDVVRLKTDEPDRLPLVIKEFDGNGAMCRSECGRRCTWAAFSDFELITRPDPHAELAEVIQKVFQATRDLLLSDEFMTAFAAAWMKTPLPLSMHFDGKDGERVQSLADYPFGEPSEGGKQ